MLHTGRHRSYPLTAEVPREEQQVEREGAMVGGGGKGREKENGAETPAP